MTFFTRMVTENGHKLQFIYEFIPILSDRKWPFSPGKFIMLMRRRFEISFRVSS